jgi:hypothetical protein
MHHAEDLPPAAPVDSSNEPVDVPRFRPKDGFWPYADLSEQPTADELAALDPDLSDALYGPRGRPFSITVVFPRFEGPDYDKALELARQASECRELGAGTDFRVRARFLPSEPLKLRDLFSLVSPHEGCQVLIDDRPVPYARELWLPLVWFLISR